MSQTNDPLSAAPEQQIPVQEELPTSYSPKQADPLPSVEYQHVVSASIQTPHLPPNFLKQYDEIVPGSAKAIFDMVIRQQEFDIEVRRHEMEINQRNIARVEQLDAANIQEQKDVALIRQGELAIKRTGQWFALILAIVLIGISVFFAYIDQPWLASIPLGMIVAVITVMFLQRQAQQQPPSESS